MSNMSVVWEYLKKYGQVTNKKIEKLTGTTCPHDVIRQIRKKYGAGVIEHEDIYKKEKRIVDGKERIQSRWFRVYSLTLDIPEYKLEGC